MFEERRHEVVALESELQHASVGHELGHLGHPIDRVCRPLLGIRLGRRKDLALTTAEAVSASDTCCSDKDANSRQKETPAEGRGLGSSDQALITWRRKRRGMSVQA